MRPAESPVWYRDRFLIAILTGSFLIKLFLAIATSGNGPVLDEGAYLSLAQGLVDGRGFEGTFRPPFYPAFMAAHLALGAGTLGIRLSQVLLSTVAVALVYVLASRTAGSSAGRLAALISATDPTLVGFSHRLWSETLFIVLLLGVLALITHRTQEQRYGRWLAGGVLLGFATLTRPMIITFLPFLLLWTAWQAWRDRDSRTWWQPPALRYALLASACLLVVLPWTWRNFQVTGTMILVDSNGPFNFLVGTEAGAAFVDKDDNWSVNFGRVDGEFYPDLVQRDPQRAQQGAMRDALANIAEAPLRYAGKSWWEAGHLWTMDSFVLRNLRNGWYGSVPRWFIAGMTVLSAGFFVVLVLGALAGLVLAEDSPLRGLTILLLLHSTLLFGITYSLSRYSVPLHPLLAVFAALAVSRWSSIRKGLRTAPARRLLASAVMLVLLLSAWRRDLPLMKDMLVNGGSHYRFTMIQTPDGE